MKRNYLFYIVLFLVGTTTFGCEKYLKELPQNKLMPTTTDDYDQLLNRAYLSEQVTPYLDFLADDFSFTMADRRPEGGNQSDVMFSAFMWFDHHEETLSNGDQAFRVFYEKIFLTNVVIKNIDNAIGVEMSATNVRRTRNNILGEAMVLRAYCYFYLVNLYAKHYDPATAAEDPGVPINLTDAVEDRPYTRSSVKEVYDLIVADLTQGIKLIEENPVTKNGKSKFYPLAAKAFLARVYLYMLEYDLAIEQASAVIRENPNIFSLHPYSSLERPTTEVAFASGVSGTDYLARGNDNVLLVCGVTEIYPWMSFWMTYGGFSISAELDAQFDEDDVRKYYFMFPHTQNVFNVTNTKLSYAKNRNISFINSWSTGPAAGYSRVIRTEEMYLILAEANARKSAPNISSAIGYLNQLREPKFREGTYVPLVASNFNQQSLIDYIAVERRRELCFEGHRWFDLRRTTRPAMQRLGRNDELCSIKQDDPRYVLQIPMRELSVNPQIGFNPR